VGPARFVAKTGVLPKKLNLRLDAGSLRERPSVETTRLVLDIDRESPGLLDREAATRERRDATVPTARAAGARPPG